MAFGKKKKEAEPVIEEAQIVEPDEPEKEWPDLSTTNQPGGEPIMAAELDTTEAGRASNGGSAVINTEEAKRTRTMVENHWVDKATWDNFEAVRAKIGPGTALRTVTDHYFGVPARIIVEPPTLPPIESYSKAEIGAKVKAALIASL